MKMKMKYNLCYLYYIYIFTLIVVVICAFYLYFRLLIINLIIYLLSNLRPNIKGIDDLCAVTCFVHLVVPFYMYVIPMYV